MISDEDEKNKVLLISLLWVICVCVLDCFKVPETIRYRQRWKPKVRVNCYSFRIYDKIQKQDIFTIKCVWNSRIFIIENISYGFYFMNGGEYFKLGSCVNSYLDVKKDRVVWKRKVEYNWSYYILRIKFTDGYEALGTYLSRTGQTYKTITPLSECIESMSATLEFFKVKNVCRDGWIVAAYFETVTSYGEVLSLGRESNLKKGIGTFYFKSPKVRDFALRQNHIKSGGLVRRYIEIEQIKTKKRGMFVLIDNAWWFDRFLSLSYLITEFEKNYPSKVYGFRYQNYLIGGVEEKIDESWATEGEILTDYRLWGIEKKTLNSFTFTICIDETIWKIYRSRFKKRRDFWL